MDQLDGKSQRRERALQRRFVVCMVRGVYVIENVYVCIRECARIIIINATPILGSDVINTAACSVLL